MKFVEHPKNPRFIDLTGNKYSRLEVLGYTINLGKKIESIMGLMQSRNYKQAREELKKVHKDILDPK